MEQSEDSTIFPAGAMSTLRDPKITLISDKVVLKPFFGDKRKTSELLAHCTLLDSECAWSEL